MNTHLGPPGPQLYTPDVHTIELYIYALATNNPNLYLTHEEAFKPGSGYLDRDNLIEAAMEEAMDDGECNDTDLFLNEADKISEDWWIELQDELNTEPCNSLAEVGMRQSDFL